MEPSPNDKIQMSNKIQNPNVSKRGKRQTVDGEQLFVISGQHSEIILFFVLAFVI